MKKQSQSGNILFLILIAIALLGALTVLMSRTGSQSDDTGSAEQSTIIATKILRHGASLKDGVQTLMTRGCGENQISFWHDSNGDGVENASDNYYNASSPTDRSCHLFHPSGAGLTFVPLSSMFPAGSTWTGTYNNFVGKSTVGGMGTTNADLYWFLSLPKNSLNLCQRINKILGYSEAAPLSTNMWATPLFTGSYEPGVAIGIPFDGRKSYCINSGGTNHYILYTVLHVR